jgi:hypothetical protein
LGAIRTANDAMNAMAGVLIIGLLGARSVGHVLKTVSACFG